MSYPQQPWGQPPGWPPQQPPPGWGQPPAPAPQNRAAIGCGVLFVLCCVFGVCVKMVARTGGGPSRSTPPPSVARAAPAVAERDASLDERLNSMPVQERVKHSPGEAGGFGPRPLPLSEAKGNRC